MENENGESWRRVLRLPVVVAMLSPLLLLADLALIAVFILQQNWHAVILLSVVLFCGAQAIYWYFRTKSILTTRQQVGRTLPLLFYSRYVNMFLNVSTGRGGEMEGGMVDGWMVQLAVEEVEVDIIT
ncbi:hypothetical protein Hamer_G024310 [Homarus americanus]|uniref:Uncharacterized protein n=1 Tax=Homarus americanus TaxID=6706 RepID=A0A8J5MZ67_HOMAM|nr:hypothetical protein Hamer_G024310 [Homarus americanus]